MKPISINVSNNELLDMFDDIKRLTYKFHPDRIDLSHFGVDIKSLLRECKHLKLIYFRQSLNIFRLNIFCESCLYKTVDIDIWPLIAFFSELISTNLVDKTSSITHVNIPQTESFEFDLVHDNDLWHIDFFIKYLN